MVAAGSGQRPQPALNSYHLVTHATYDNTSTSPCPQTFKGMGRGLSLQGGTLGEAQASLQNNLFCGRVLRAYADVSRVGESPRVAQRKDLRAMDHAGHLEDRETYMRKAVYWQCSK